jgi:hypothetical protein
MGQKLERELAYEMKQIWMEFGLDMMDFKLELWDAELEWELGV